MTVTLGLSKGGSQVFFMKPRALLIFPPLYDVAAYDVFLKPSSLLRLGAWLERGGYAVALINALDYTEAESLARLGAPRRYADGTGKFFRQKVSKPAVFKDIPRYFSRYGVLRSVIEDAIRAARPDIILISSGMTYWYPGVQEAVACARTAAPGAPVVVGGVYATLCHEHARRTSGADQVIAGPALPALAALLEKHALPVPAGRPSGRLLLLEQGFLGAAAVRLHTGCPLSCAYCASSLVSGVFSAGRGEDLFEQVRAVHQRLGIRHFGFYDDALLARPEHGLIPFLERVIASGLDLRFHVPNGLHVALITEENARLMRRAGVCNFKLGYESAAEEFHAAHDRKHDHEMFERAVQCLQSGGYKASEVAVYVLAGLPGQPAEEVENSIRTAAKTGVQVYVAEYSPIPGTPLWGKSRALSRFPLEEEPLTQNNSIFPMQWERFTVARMQELKQLAWRLTRCHASTGSG
jgi:radical SAM superfamily enzyme YgiQ (UPF0313 family)